MSKILQAQLYNLSMQLDRLENNRIYELNGVKWDGGLRKNIEDLKRSLSYILDEIEKDPSLISEVKERLFKKN